ncbi:MAG: CHRD domain-containing protein [Verrucomicrobiota bacterium]
MKLRTASLPAAVGLLVSLPLHAAVFDVEISPSKDALNLGSSTYTQDHALGLGAANETAQPASAASGGEIGGGLTYDDVTNVLSFEFAYGSDFGFNDLLGNWTLTHLHAPGPVNFPAMNGSGGVIHDLAGFHTPGSSTKTGSFDGSVVLTPTQEQDLFDNEIYINIHSSDFGAGEIRGQLVVVPEPSTSMLALGAAGLLLVRRRRA